VTVTGSLVGAVLVESERTGIAEAAGITIREMANARREVFRNRLWKERVIEGASLSI
jgi:hypothetical protein